MSVIAIDPGSEKSAVVCWDGENIGTHFDIPNEQVLEWLSDRYHDRAAWNLVIEKLQSYGKPVGEEVFETAFWSGRFAQAYYGGAAGWVHRLPRMDVKINLCGSSRANDSMIRAALIRRLGAPGDKIHPGPTFGITGDQWAALGVAVTWHDRETILRRIR